MDQLSDLSPWGSPGFRILGLRTRQIRLPAIGWDLAEVFRLKASFERVLVTITLPVWGAVLGLLWLVIKLSDLNSPALLSQERAGMRGVKFRVLKLRTMVPNAKELEQSLAKYNLSTGPDFKMRNDPRITFIGRILRKSHLDELPQLINVLKGEMSLVGPRPCTVTVEAYKGWWWPRLLSKPGLTGLFQIYRAETHDFDERVRLEVCQIRTRSFINDARMISRTLLVAFVQRKGF